MTLGGFFGGGAKGVTWPEKPDTPGGRTTVAGTIETVHPPEPIIDMVTNQPTEKMQVRIVLTTAERDPSDPNDDGRRTLYVKSWMRGAIGEALRKAGVKEPEVGGTLAVQFTHLTPPDRPGLNPNKHFAAAYNPPPTAVADHFGTGAAPGPVAPAPVAAPPVAPAPAAPIPAAVQAAFPTATVVPPPAEAPPVKPAEMSDVAWAAMDVATQRVVAATMGAGAPPY